MSTDSPQSPILSLSHNTNTTSLEDPLDLRFSLKVLYFYEQEQTYHKDKLTIRGQILPQSPIL
jgi:hypothetical protein